VTTASPSSQPFSERFLKPVTTSATGDQLIRLVPHAGQQLFLDSDHPRRLLVCHRRWGKDMVSIIDIHRLVSRWKDEPHRKQLSPAISIGVVYPTFPLAREFWSALKRMTPKEDVAKINEAMPPRMTLHCGAEIEVRSGSDPDMMVAAGYDLVIFGEAARIPYDSWLTIMPALASPGRAGMAVHQTTPKGMNWIAREQDSDAWWTLTVPIYGEDGNRHPYANPHITDEAIASEREQMPERWFQQEWMADFLTGEGAVFRNVRDRIAAAPAVPKLPLVCGVDLAKHSDYSVFAVFDADGHMVAIDRMNQVSYPIQSERLISLLRDMSVKHCVIESNGPGDPFYDNVLRDLHTRRQEFQGQPTLVPFATTAQSKRQMIDALVVAFERGSITILDDPDLVNEFEAFEMTQTAAGNIRFSAPEGGWDDRVMACALAWTEISARLRNRPALLTSAVHNLSSGVVSEAPLRRGDSKRGSLTF